MTKYDPFSFGMLPARESAPAADVDDTLFAAPAVAPAPAKAGGDDDWQPPVDPPASAFEAETAPAVAPVAASSAPPVPTTRATVRPTATPRPAAPTPMATPKPTVVAPTKKKPPAAPPRQLAPLPLPKRPGAWSVVVPLTMFGAGGSTSAWFFLAQQNPVMGGILAAASLVGSALAFVFLRR
jgi:hypothetical protein